MAADLTPSDIAWWRMRAQGLLGPGFATPVEAVTRLAAFQFQDHQLAMWSLVQRVSGASIDDVQRVFDDGGLLRTHVLRPTWHAVAADDVRWMLELTAPRVHIQNGTCYRRYGLDDETLARAHDVLRDVLADGAHRTRAELAVALAAADVPVDDSIGLVHVLMHAELEGVICSGRMRGRQQTYALLADRAPTAHALAPDVAAAELVLRYVAGHGPATAQDLRWWSSLTVRRIDAALEQVGDQLHREVVDGRTYLAVGPPPAAAPPEDPVVRLVTPLDEYVVGYAESRDVVDPSGADAAHRDTPGLATALVLVDGQIAGRWRRKARADRIDVEAVTYRPLDDDELAALHAEAERHAAAHGREATFATSVL